MYLSLNMLKDANKPISVADAKDLTFQILFIKYMQDEKTETPNKFWLVHNLLIEEILQLVRDDPEMTGADVIKYLEENL